MDFLSTASTHLSSAKRILGLKVREKHTHAALELRLCLEALVYYQAERISKHLEHESWKTWQPQKLINEMTEIDEAAAQTVHVAVEGLDGSFQPVGSTRPLTFEEIKSYYHYLGSFLHHTVSGRALNERVFEDKKLKGLIEILELAVMPSISFFNFSQPFSFDCEKCQQRIARKISFNTKRINIHCPHTNCCASYDVSFEGEALQIEPAVVRLLCPNTDCAAPLEIWSRRADLGRRFACVHCNTVSVLRAGLALEV